ncbi:hypothetical protein ASZ90_009046 [hydrocarbon metagenome]|uniref:Uncharacterized protein n=1 Tax=hydrocarbon metagenome TaxID=938273 RepID=A0A0W8FJV3_9ZZZZ
MPGIAAAGEGERLVLKAEHGGVVPVGDRAEADVFVVLLRHPVLPPDLGMGEHPEGKVFDAPFGPDKGGFGNIGSLLPDGAGCASDKEIDRQIADDLSIKRHNVPGLCNDLPDIAPPQVVLLCNRAHERDVFCRHLDEHPLLRFCKHDLPGGHALFAEVDAIGGKGGAEGAGHLARAPRKPCRTQVAAGEDLSRLRHLEDRIDQQLLGIRIPYLDARPILRLGILGKIARRERCAAEPVASGGRPDEHQAAARLLDPCRQVAIRVHDAHTDDVHERIAAVTGIEDQLPADDRDTDAVAVVPDPGDHMLKQIPVLLAIQRAEIEGIHEGDRACAHGEDVPHDPADPGGGTVVGIHVTRMVMALHPYCNGAGIAEAHDGGIVSRTQQHTRTIGGEGFEQGLCGPIAAVFAPEVLEAGNLDVCQVAL